MVGHAKGFACDWFFRVLLLAIPMVFCVGRVAAVPDTTAAYYADSATLTDGAVVLGHVSYLSGVTVAAGASATLQTAGRLNGALTFGSSSSALVLADDLNCGSQFAISGNGIINGGGRTMRLSGNLTLNSSNKFQLADSDLVIDGGGRVLTLASAGSITLGNSRTLTLRNMTLCLQATTPFSVGIECGLVLDNVAIVLQGSTDPMEFRLGNSPSQLALSIYNNVVFKPIGSSSSVVSFKHDLCQTATTIKPGACLRINPGVNFIFSPNDTSSSGSPAFLAFESATSVLYLDGCIFTVNALGTYAGLRMTKGVVIFDNLVVIDNGGNTDATRGFILGDGDSAANDVDAIVQGGATVIVDGYLHYKCA